MTEVKHGRDPDLERLADKILTEGLSDNKRSIDRDIEKMMYQGGHLTMEELRVYDPGNDWDTQDSAYSILVEPAKMQYIEPSITHGDENVRARNPRLLERQALMRHVGEGNSPPEDIPLLGINDGRRKVCGRCQQAKGLPLFSPKNDAKDGLHPWCKKCRKDTVPQNRKTSRSGK